MSAIFAPEKTLGGVVGTVVNDAKLGDLLLSIVTAVADAQVKLDENSVNQTKRLAETLLPGTNQSLLSLGLQPAFYHFQYVDIDLSVSICMRIQNKLSVNLEADYGKGNAHSDGASVTSVGQVELTIVQGDPAPAVGALLITSYGDGVLTFKDPAATAPDNETAVRIGAGLDIVPDPARGMVGLAMDLAEHLQGPDSGGPGAVPAILSAVAGVFREGAAVPTASNNVDCYTTTPNRVVVLTDATPAVAWVGVKGTAGYAADVAVNHSLVVGTTVTPVAEATVTGVVTTATTDKAAAVELVDALDGTPVAGLALTAEVLFSAGKLVSPVYFNVAHTTLFQRTDTDGADDQRHLDALVAMMKAAANLKITVTGHASQEGSTSQNKQLCVDRRDAVIRYLTAHGIDAARIKAGEGSIDAGTPYTSKRRAEITLDNGPAEVVMITATPAPNSGLVKWPAAGFAADWLTTVAQQDSKAAPPSLSSNDRITLGAAPSQHTLTAVAAATSAAARSYAIGATNARLSSGQIATNIATAVNRDVTGHAAIAVGNVVHIFGPGTVMGVVMATTRTGRRANEVTVAGTPPARFSGQPFRGGADGGQPMEGDELSFAGTVLEAVALGGSPGPDQFEIGVDGEETAANIAASINGISGWTAAAAGEKITVTGPAGSAVRGNRPAVYVFSRSALSGMRASAYEQNASASAFTASGDVHFSHKFDLKAHASASVKGRLVAIPAPIPLLELLADYYERVLP